MASTFKYLTPQERARYSENCTALEKALPGVRRFEDEKPVRDYVKLYRDRDGSITEYPTPIDLYRKYVALYGEPFGCWRYAEGA